MKKILLLLCVAVILGSCAVQYQEKRYILDYRPFLEQGFTLTPSVTINEPHECLASIWLEIIPGKKSQTVRVSDGQGKMIEKKIATKERKGDSVDEALEYFVKYAKELGANGAIDLKTNVRSIQGIRIYELSGCAVNIKR